MFKTKVINSQNSSLPNYFTIICALEVTCILVMEILQNGVYISSLPHDEK